MAILPLDPSPGRFSSRTVVLIGVGLALTSLAFIFAAGQFGRGSAMPFQASTEEIHGTVKVYGTGGTGEGMCGYYSARDKSDLMNRSFTTPEPCPQGLGGGYSDMRDGARVTVTDESGKLVAVSELLDGQVSGVTGQWRFKIEVPESETYGITVGNRDEYQVMASELEAKGWRLDLALGG